MYTVLIKPTHGLAEPATRSGKTASRCQTFLLPMVWLVYALFLLSLVFSVREAHPQTGVVPPIASRTVLILSGLTSNDPSVKLLVPALYETLIAGGVREHNIYIEYLDLYRFPSPRVAEEKKALLMAKYAETHLDLLIPISQAAVDFVARELEHLYLEVPMLVPFITAEPEWKGIRRPMISQIGRASCRERV